jgi:hypothetical protein
MESSSFTAHRALHAQRGSVVIIEVVLCFIIAVVVTSVMGAAAIQHRVVRSTVEREQAFQIAEAGVNYYEWRLGQFPTDYTNGTGSTGPYVIDYRDSTTSDVVGHISLEITPPAAGSSIVTIRSTGWTIASPAIRRTITVRFGRPSLAQYALLTNTNLWVGSSESITGKLHANGGVRFDGSAGAPITSARATYTCPTWSGLPCPTTKPGIWGAATTTTQSFWQYPVPQVDFTSVTANLATVKSAAQTDGIYLPPSNAQGYSLVFNSNGSVTVYRVISLTPHATGWDVDGNAHNEDIVYNGRTFMATYTLPTNGLIYSEDKTWVEGTVNGRALVAAARLPYNAATAPSIIIANNIQYLARDGNNSLGLIGQKDILIAYNAPNSLAIDGALIAQNGSTQFYYWPSNVKTSISIYGSIASFGVWTWNWVNGSGAVISGYQNTSTTYDSNLLYNPPPNFPLSAEGYQQISWQAN